MTNTPKYLKNHSQYSQADYAYLSNKGYTNKEIKNIWDKEIGKNAPVQHFNSVENQYANQIAYLKSLY